MERNLTIAYNKHLVVQPTYKFPLKFYPCNDKSHAPRKVSVSWEKYHHVCNHIRKTCKDNPRYSEELTAQVAFAAIKDTVPYGAAIHETCEWATELYDYMAEVEYMRQLRMQLKPMYPKQGINNG